MKVRTPAPSLNLFLQLIYGPMRKQWPTLQTSQLQPNLTEKIGALPKDKRTINFYNLQAVHIRFNITAPRWRDRDAMRTNKATKPQTQKDRGHWQLRVNLHKACKLVRGTHRYMRNRNSWSLSRRNQLDSNRRLCSDWINLVNKPLKRKQKHKAKRSDQILWMRLYMRGWFPNSLKRMQP